MKSVFSQNAGIKLEVETSYIAATKDTAVTLYSTYAHAKNPDEARRLLQINLSRDALRDLVAHLSAELEKNPEPALA